MARRTKFTTGQDWERRIEAMHAHYEGVGITAERTVPPFRVIRRMANGELLIRFIGSGVPDYLAVVDGEPVRFDAKSTEMLRLPFSMISADQAGALTRHERVGVSAIFAKVGDAQWWIPWSALCEPYRLWMEGQRDASVNTEWLRQNAVYVEGADWLSALREARRKRNG